MINTNHILIAALLIGLATAGQNAGSETQVDPANVTPSAMEKDAEQVYARFIDVFNGAAIAIGVLMSVLGYRYKKFTFFVIGFIVAENGIHFPWDLANGVSYESIAQLGAPAQFDAIPTAGKLQFLAFIGLLEFAGEAGKPHYMSGGKPGAFPSLKKAGFPHPVPFDLFDPFGLSKNASPEKKAKGLLTEINNGRLAQLGIMGFMAESKIPGSVPALKGLIAPYAGEVMAPFSAGDADLPYVADMLKVSLF